MTVCLRAEEADDKIITVVQPDIAVIGDPAKLDIRGCRGAPMLLSKSSPRAERPRIRFEKMSLYEKHGVREYWLVIQATG